MKSKNWMVISLGVVGVIALSVWLFFHFRGGKMGKTQISFYSWNNSFELDSTTYEFLNDHKIKHLHVKLAELAWNESAQKVVVSNHLDGYTRGLEHQYFQENQLTPVVFLDNELFYHIDSAQIPQMASLAKRAIQIHSVDLAINGQELFANRWESLYFSLNPKSVDNEQVEKNYQRFLNNIVSYEFDCDWTEMTRDKYFYFLQLVKDTLDKNIESTLRLHQYKFREKMGIPPVDLVNLMCYNVGNVTNPKETNSIFQSQVILDYMKNQDRYPVPLNLAFPTFEWTVVFRNQKFYRLIQGNGILEHPNQLKEIGQNTYQLTSDVYIDWRIESLQEGDVVRVETARMEDISKTYAEILQETKEKPEEIILFDLNSSLSKDKSHELEKILPR
ncbi:MAG: hypothetical protein K2Q22_12045 [Cytophagales bacterium]|nr:hypothetical protein [Cytophagales bacterium]